MEETSQTQWDEDGRLEVLTFDLQTEKFAIEAVLVREILDLLPETVVPGADRLVASVANFRGKIIPIADLRLAFGLPSAESTMDSRVVVVELDVDGGQTQIGIRTDKVHEVTTLHRDASETPPTVGLRWRRDYIRELVRTPQGVIVLANIAKIFDPLLGGRGATAVLAPALL